MGLGMNQIGNNWKYALGNFIVMFVVQLIFQMNDLLSTPELYPSMWQVLKCVTTSAVATLIFAGYNKLAKEKED